MLAKYHGSIISMTPFVLKIVKKRDGGMIYTYLSFENKISATKRWKSRFREEAGNRETDFFRFYLHKTHGETSRRTKYSAPSETGIQP